MNDFIEIKNARIHNLKSVDVKIPRGKLTVITGVSGSGKSSLAFDTLYEEGRRRYLMFSGTQLMLTAFRLLTVSADCRPLSLSNNVSFVSQTREAPSAHGQVFRQCLQYFLHPMASVKRNTMTECLLQ